MLPLHAHHHAAKNCPRLRPLAPLPAFHLLVLMAFSTLIFLSLRASPLIALVLVSGLTHILSLTFRGSCPHKEQTGTGISAQRFIFISFFHSYFRWVTWSHFSLPSEVHLFTRESICRVSPIKFGFNVHSDETSGLESVQIVVLAHDKKQGAWKTSTSLWWKSVPCLIIYILIVFPWSISRVEVPLLIISSRWVFTHSLVRVSGLNPLTFDTGQWGDVLL